MRKIIVLQHQNAMFYSKEFLQLKIPSEVRVLLYVITLLAVTAVALIFLGKTDDVIKAEGIVRTEENVSSVKNVISGKIISKKYMPGQKVNKNDFLYEIDHTFYDSQRQNLISERENLEAKINTVNQLLASHKKNRNLIDRKNLVAYTRYESYRKNFEKLVIQTNISHESLLDEQSNPASLRNEKTIRQKMMEYEYNRKNLESYEADFIKSLNQEKEDLDLLYSKNIQEIQKLDSSYEFLKIFAPVDGYIQENSSLNIGDYLESGANVLNIIPNDEKHFRVEIHVSPKDMGKIKQGLKVKYRLSAFPFFEYKGAEGIITAIDPDIRSDNNGMLYYIIYADLDKASFINRHGDVFPVRAGLETNCRIILETEKIFIYMLRKMDFLY